jgi:hypothetical protein
VNKSEIDNRQSKMFGRVALTGKAVVSKTTAHLSLAGSTPVPSAKIIADFRLPIADWPEIETNEASRQRVGNQETKNRERSPKHKSAIGNRNRKCLEASPNGMAAVC